MVVTESGHWLLADARDTLDKGALGLELEANWRKFVRMALRTAAILKIDPLPGQKFLESVENEAVVASSKSFISCATEVPRTPKIRGPML